MRTIRRDSSSRSSSLPSSWARSMRSRAACGSEVPASHAQVAKVPSKRDVHKGHRRIPVEIEPGRNLIHQLGQPLGDLIEHVLVPALEVSLGGADLGEPMKQDAVKLRCAPLTGRNQSSTRVRRNVRQIMRGLVCSLTHTYRHSGRWVAVGACGARCVRAG